MIRIILNERSKMKDIINILLSIQPAGLQLFIAEVKNKRIFDNRFVPQLSRVLSFLRDKLRLVGVPLPLKEPNRLITAARNTTEINLTDCCLDFNYFSIPLTCQFKTKILKVG